MKVTTEAFNNIKALKMNNYEKFFSKKIQEARDKEIKCLKKELV